MAEKTDWAAVKSAYITTDASLEVLGKQFGVSKKTMAQRCSKEGWVKLRKEYRQKVAQKVISKTASSTSSTVASALRRSWRAADKIVEIIDREADRMLEDKMPPSSKAINNLADSLDKLTAVLRNAGNAPTKLEKQQLKISRERLDLEKAKQQAAMDGGGNVEINLAGGVSGYAE